MTGTDAVDAAAGLAPGSPVAELRRQREQFVRHTQGSHDVLITPDEPAGVSLIERAAAALRTAAIGGDAPLIAHYRSRLHDIGANATLIAAAEHGPGTQAIAPRLTAILRHVSLIAATPRAANPTHLDALREAGLTPRDIVTIAQLVAFVSYQTRVVVGLRLLNAESTA
jgi:CMD domain protein